MYNSCATYHTHAVHLPNDCLADLLGCGDLRFLSEHPANQRPEDEQHTLAGIDSIHMGGAGPWVGHQTQDVVDDLRDVPLEPDGPHAPHKLDICLQT